MPTFWIVFMTANWLTLFASTPQPSPPPPPLLNNSKICGHFCVISADSYIYCDKEPNFSTIENMYIWNCGLKEYNTICNHCPIWPAPYRHTSTNLTSARHNHSHTKHREHRKLKKNF